MSWQDEEKKKRLAELEKQARAKNRKEHLLEIQRSNLRQFLEKLVEANNKLDNMLRLSSPIIQNDIDNSVPKIHIGYPNLYARFDVKDETLYLVEEREIFKMFGGAIFPPYFTELKRRDYIHYAINNQNVDSVISIILRNKCTGQQVTYGLGSPTFTIKGFEEYNSIIEKQTNPK